MTCQNVLLSHSSLRSPPLLPAPPHPSPPPADSSDVAGRTAAKREALWDVGGLCFPGNRGCPAAADGQAEESAAAGAQSQGECFICLYSNEAQSRSVKTMYLHVLMFGMNCVEKSLLLLKGALESIGNCGQNLKVAPK